MDTFIELCSIVFFSGMILFALGRGLRHLFVG